MTFTGKCTAGVEPRSFSLAWLLSSSRINWPPKDHCQNVRSEAKEGAYFHDNYLRNNFKTAIVIIWLISTVIEILSKGVLLRLEREISPGVLRDGAVRPEGTSAGVWSNDFQGGARGAA